MAIDYNIIWISLVLFAVIAQCSDGKADTTLSCTPGTCTFRDTRGDEVELRDCCHLHTCTCNHTSEKPTPRRTHRHAYLANAKLPKIELILQYFHNPASLVTLLLRNNSISEIGNGIFYRLNNLHRLHLIHNHLKMIHENSFKGLSNLIELNLKDNYISVIDDGAFDDLCTLQYCDVSHNRLAGIHKGVLKHLFQLRFLNLSSNLLSAFHDGIFKNCSNLETLDINHNNFSELKPGMFTGLDVLLEFHAGNNSISAVMAGTFGIFKNLTILDLSHNRLQQLATGIFTNLGLLRYLNLSSNQLDHIISSESYPFVESTELETIDLTNNSLAWVTPPSFSGLCNTTNVHVDNYPTCCFICAQSATCCVNDTCSSDPHENITCTRLLLNDALSVTVAILAICSIVGNICVIGFQCRQRSHMNAVHVLLVGNLSLSDLLMGTYLLLLASADWYYKLAFPTHSQAWHTNGICVFASIANTVSCEASMCFITLISIDRFLCVEFSTRVGYRIGKKAAYITVSLVWLTTIAIGLTPQIMMPDLEDTSAIGNRLADVCISIPLSVHIMEENDALLQIIIFILIFIIFNSICLFIVAACYTKIFASVWKASRKFGRHQLSRREVNMAWNMGAMVLTDFAVWLPLIIIFIMELSEVHVISPRQYMSIVVIVFPFNSCINPFLYSFSRAIANQLMKRKRHSSAT